jgi:hypothetical protein
MARTAVTATAFTPNAKLVRPAGTTIDATLVTNGVVISGAPLEEIVVEVTNTFAGAKIVTIQSGDNPPGFAAGQGDMTGSLAQNEVAYFGPFDSSRFVQKGTTTDPATGALWVDFESGTTGTIRAYRVPRST